MTYREDALLNEIIAVIDETSAYLREAYALRVLTFMEEQQIAEKHIFDELDTVATHIVAVQDNEVVGTLRMLDRGDYLKIGLVAVRKSRRRSGVGERIMNFALAHAANQGYTEIKLSAQLVTEGFYANLGFVPAGDIFQEASIAHLPMRKSL